MKKRQNTLKRPSTGNLSSPKTNEDFNKKQPKRSDPQMRQVKPEPARRIPTDLLEDESADPGDADGNGNLIGNDEQELWDEPENNEINKPVKPKKRIKNPDARTL
jgi:hypothetical protein